MLGIEYSSTEERAVLEERFLVLGGDKQKKKKKKKNSSLRFEGSVNKWRRAFPESTSCELENRLTREYLREGGVKNKVSEEGSMRLYWGMVDCAGTHRETQSLREGSDGRPRKGFHESGRTSPWCSSEG